MPSSPTDICNLALGHLGEAPIVSLDEDHAAARACALHYDLCRDAALRAHRWNFAIGRAALSRLEAAPVFGWSSQYELPADCLRVLDFNGDSGEDDDPREPYLIEGRRLLTDSAVARIVYVRREEDVTQYDSLFVESLALRLAIALSESMRGSTGKTEELTQAHERLIAPLARRIDANEGRRRVRRLPLDAPSIQARYRGAGMNVGRRRDDFSW